VVARSDSLLLDVVPLLPGGIGVAWIVVVVVVAADDDVAAADDDVVVAQGIPSSPRNCREIDYPDIVVDIEKWNQ
ncbi:hypothetical protein A2U01_0098149, partial [Trifolium medium]|nr:hypothetical protein [Trifolium medium]